MAKITQDKATVQEYTEKLIQMTNVFLNGMPISISSLPPELQEVARANPKQALTIWTIDQGE